MHLGAWVALVDVGVVDRHGPPSGPSTSVDSSYQLSGARVPQNERQRGSLTDQRSGSWSGSPV